MESWYHSDVTHTYMDGLVKRGLLCGRTNAVEWLVPSREEVSAPPDGYIMSFMPFHEYGFAIPLTRSFRGCCTTTKLSYST